MPVAAVLLLIVVIVVLLLISGSFFTVPTAQAAIIQRFGRFLRLATPGLNFKLPFFDSIAKRINMRVQQLDVVIESKTKDNVFVQIPVSIQYQVKPDKVYEAFYKLNDPSAQIQSYVFNVILGHVPKLNLDEAFLQQSDIAMAVKNELDAIMAKFGYDITKALVTDLKPDEKVKSAMNDINAAQREQVAATARGEADKILKVKQAEAEAESKALQGEGIANQRKAIIAGLQQSVELFQKSVAGATAQDVLMLVMMTQYLDTLKDLGANSRSNTVLVPHSPGGLAEFFAELRNTVTIGMQAAEYNTGRKVPKSGEKWLDKCGGGSTVRAQEVMQVKFSIAIRFSLWVLAAAALAFSLAQPAVISAASPDSSCQGILCYVPPDPNAGTCDAKTCACSIPGSIPCVPIGG